MDAGEPKQLPALKNYHYKTEKCSINESCDFLAAYSWPSWLNVQATVLILFCQQPPPLIKAQNEVHVDAIEKDHQLIYQRLY